MSEDWSLKDKQFMVDDGYALLSCHKVDKEGLFVATDIEILRRKLIDKIEGIWIKKGRYQNKLKHDEIIYCEEITDIIDYLFGVVSE